ncbi:MAG TPA: hypothetical protein VFL76_09465 [Edaphocola sp.]|nr:hypothetical protein [Edaphocola sp.]
MLEQFQDLIKGFGQQAVINNQAVPNEQNEAVMSEAQQVIQDGMQQMAQNGQLQELAQQVQNGQDSATHPATQQIQSNMVSSLRKKFGLDSAAASGVASSLIPSVLNKVLGSSSDFNLNGLLSSFGSGSLGSTISNISGKLGLDKDKDGDVDMNDIKSLF